MSVEELVKRLRGVCFLQSPLFGQAADKLEELAAENERLTKSLDANWVQHQRVVKAEAALAEAKRENEALRELIRWAHNTLIEINPSNYDHDEVCRLNDASVEVILGIAPTLGETHGYTKDWWEARNAGGKDAE